MHRFGLFVRFAQSITFERGHDSRFDATYFRGVYMQPNSFNLPLILGLLMTRTFPGAGTRRLIFSMPTGTMCTGRACCQRSTSTKHGTTTCRWFSRSQVRILT